MLDALVAPPSLAGASPGRPLAPDVRGAMESRFGVCLGHVVVHDDAGAHAFATGLSAKACTLGDHIFFSEGRYRPETRDGKRLLAHELAHVIQQSRAAGGSTAASEALEREATESAESIASGAGPVRVANAAGPAAMCDGEDDPARMRGKAAKDQEMPPAQYRAMTGVPCAPDAATSWEQQGSTLTVTQTIHRRGMYSRLVTTIDAASGRVLSHTLLRRDDDLNPHWTDVTKEASRDLGPALSVEWRMPDTLTDAERMDRIQSPGVLGTFFSGYLAPYKKDQTLQVQSPLYRMQARTLQTALAARDRVIMKGAEFALSAYSLKDLPALVSFARNLGAKWGAYRAAKAAEASLQESVATASRAGKAAKSAPAPEVVPKSPAPPARAASEPQPATAIPRETPVAAPPRAEPTLPKIKAKRARASAKQGAPATAQAPAPLPKPKAKGRPTKASQTAAPAAAKPPPTAKKPAAPKPKPAVNKAAAPKTRRARKARTAAQATAPKPLEERIAEAKRAIPESRAKWTEYKEARVAAGEKPKGGPAKDFYNKKENVYALERAQAFPERQVLEQAELVGIRKPDGTMVPTRNIAGEARIPDVVEINGAKATGIDVKSRSEILGSIEGGVTKPGDVYGTFRPTSKPGLQHAKEDAVLKAVEPGDKLVFRGRDVRTGETVTHEIDPGNYSRNVVSYEDVRPN